MSRFIITVIACVQLAACATPTQQPDPAPAVAISEHAEQQSPDIPERALPADSVYPLLVAEFALRRNDYETANSNYQQQAPLLRDAKVSAHATHLAQFMRREADALTSADLWAQIEPTSVEANGTLATLLIRQGRPVQALQHLAVVQRQGKEVKFTSALAGFDKLEESVQNEVDNRIEQLLAEFPQNTELLLSRALVDAELHRYQQSLATLKTLFKLQPLHSQALVLEAKVLMTTGADHPFARLENTLTATPDNAQLRLEYARLLTNTDIKAARAQFEILSAAAPHDADLLLSLALINRETGDHLEARAYLRQLISMGKRQNEAHYYLGRIAQDQHDNAEALAQYMLVGDGREYLDANSRIGRILVGAGELDKNHEWFAQQRTMQPARAEVLYAMESELLTQASENERAMRVLNSGLARFPASAGLLYARSMLGEQQGDLALMEQDLRTILKHDPDNSTALNALGYTLSIHTQRYSEALALVSRALKLQPEEPAIMDSMGWVLYRTGRYQEALDYLTRAYAALPDGEVAAHLGEVLWISGDKDKARNIWRGALLKQPQHRVLLETLQRLGVEHNELAPADSPSNSADSGA